MRYYLVYDKKDGRILHVHSMFDGATGTFLNLKKEEVLSTLSDLFPEPEKVDVLGIEEPLNSRMRVNIKTKKLEKIPTKKKEKV
jgi:hypothetical protein